ncbi:MAG: Asp23/Gls24 family envelope stress response protein, partial [Solobacterium sp.]|nr:Asp23/Gls24 family envelope stress response protein [Solobacterium sp.]
LNIIVDINVKYGANVNATCELVQNKIYENVAFMTGYKPNDVTVNVLGFDI